MPTTRAPVVVFDIDGTLLDSATGIVAGFQHALRSVGFAPPSEAALRADLGPPVDSIFTALGLPANRLVAAVQAYRAFYLRSGLQQSTPYPGVIELLQTLAGVRVPMGVATAKRTTLARAILDHHDLLGFFVAVSGTEDDRITKTATLTHALVELGRPAPARVAMVGDRASDVAAAVSCGVLPVAVSWGYGSPAELSANNPVLLSHPAELLDLPLLSPLLPETMGR